MNRRQQTLCFTLALGLTSTYICPASAQPRSDQASALNLLPADVQSIFGARAYRLKYSDFQKDGNTLEENVVSLQGLSAGELAPKFADALAGLQVTYAITGFRRMR